jgi:hypothetical protein
MEDARPIISRRDVSWHATCAAIRARKQAEAAGIDPEAKHALIHAAAAAPAMPPITLGTLWAIEEMDKVEPLLCGQSYQAGQVLQSLTLLDPERVLVSLLADDLADIQAGMLDTAAIVTPEQARDLDRWLSAELARLKHLAGGSATDGPEKK